MTETTFDNKCYILADLWMNYRDEEDFRDFVDYSDLGLPLAYAIDNDMFESTDITTKFVTETFDLLLAGLSLTDTGFETLDDVFVEAAKD